MQKRLHIRNSDFILATIMAAVMATLFVTLSHGYSLIATFVPGLVATWLLFGWLHRTRKQLPSFADAAPIFMITVAVQFLHFAEEWLTGFRVLFPEMYGGAPYSDGLFVLFNMASYAVFVASFALAYSSGRTFLLFPSLFFLVYGALGNAASHSWWSLSEGEYFPGLYTAQLYWLLGPVALYRFIRNLRALTVLIIGFGGSLSFLLWKLAL